MPKESSSTRCDLRSFLSSVLSASEKAATIARCCRAEEQLFSLLVQEKTSQEHKNSRFLQDFKTLADVLVQEAVRHDICKKFPGMGQRVQGEESNLFTNTLGETICVQVLSTESDTAALLSKVLDGNKTVAALLARAVFQEDNSYQDPDLVKVEGEIDLENIGIWIDPIDSTSEYIHGNREEPDSTGLVRSGLQCACVLIGAYEINSGFPQLGVVNQPFSIYDQERKLWTGRCYWGLATPFVRVHSSLSAQFSSISSGAASTTSATSAGGESPCSSPSSAIWRPQRTIVVSASESSSLISRLKERYRILPVAGAGYKLLAVARGLADIYLLSKGSTYLWDTCGPHALLRSIGGGDDNNDEGHQGGLGACKGGVVSFRRIMELNTECLLDELESLQLTYHKGGVKGVTNQWCNFEGVLAYNNVEVLLELVDFLRGVTDKYSEMEETAL